MMSHIWPAAFRRAWRLQRRAPGAALLIVATLAAGLGADVTVFSIADPLLFRPLPFANPAELVVVTSSFPGMHLSGMGLSGPEALEFSALTRAFAASGAVAFSTVTVATRDRPVRASAAMASAGLFAALRPLSARGRLYTADEDRPGAAPVAVMSDAFWRRAYGADPNVVGRVIDIDGRPATVVGILPPRADLLNRHVDVFLPLALTAATAGGRADHRFTIIARRLPEVGPSAAGADVRAAVARWQLETREFHSPSPAFHPLEVRPLSDVVSGPSARPMAALSGAVALVLLLACANVANLMLARTEGRRTEIGVEMALGAGTRHLVRLYLAEAVLLSSAGAAGALILSAFAINAVRAFGPALVRPDDITMNARVFAFTAVATLATTLAIGLLPLLRLDLQRAQRWLQAGGRGSVGGPRRARIQQALVAVQVATGVALSAAGLVTIGSLAALTSLDLGFRPERIMRVEVQLPEASYQNDEAVWSFYERAVARVAALPGVAGAAVMSGLPPLRAANNTTFVLDGAATLDHRNVPQVEFVQEISPRYFDVMGIPLVAGRALTAADTASSAPVLVVNETLAERFWPGQTALGHRLRPAGLGTPWFTVVGVAKDVRQAGVHEPPGSEVYVAHRQGRLLFPTFLPQGMNLIATAEGDPRSVVPAVRQILHAVDPAVAISGGGLLSDLVAQTIAQPRLLTWLLTAFAGMALLLAAVGVFGVTSATVSARTAEFGVRVALGATPVDVLREVLRSGGAALGLGVAGGGGLALAAVRYLSTVLFAVAPWNPAPVAWASLLLVLTGLAAAAIPAIRAARLDPTVALRSS